MRCDMEEDIKILKEFVKYYEEEAISRKFRGTLRISVDEDDIQAIENILNRLEQDERVIEEMAEYIHITQHCKVIFGGKKPVPYLKEEIIKHYRKRVEENGNR